MIVATRNVHKLRELRAILGASVSLEPLPEGVPDVEETGETFAENAALKARAAARATGQPALADDSGLCVDALGGAPGIRSARYAGGAAANIARLLAALDGVPDERRGAHFACVLALAWPDGRAELFEGRLDGRIGHAPRGAHGFGYDPVFVLDDGRALAELEPAEKDRISHRARAAERLRAFLLRA